MFDLTVTAGRDLRSATDQPDGPVGAFAACWMMAN
jgi:hypothetical protein